MKNWSKELPTKPGFYFCRELSSGIVLIYELVHSCNGEPEWMEMGLDILLKHDDLKKDREWMEIECPVEGYEYNEKYYAFKKKED